jgi:glycine oxidase
VRVTIVGAGIVGCAIAYELVSRGAVVQVVESRGVGLGATRASAGILAPHIEAHSDALLRLASCSLGAYDDFVARVRADSTVGFEYERRGTLQVAVDPVEASALAAAAERLAALDVPHELVEGGDVRSLEGALSARVVAALLVHDHGYVVPDLLAGALAEAASRLGATFVTAHATAVHGDDARAEVVTAAGTVCADAVIVAGGSWSSALIGGGAVPVRPIRGQLLHLRTDRRLASRVIWGTRCYIVPRSDGSVLVGATVEDVGFDERATAGGVRGLLEAAIALVPELDLATFGEVRVGFRPMTEDELPAIGLSSTMPRVSYATGHYRNGVLLAPLTALMMADLVLDGRERPESALTRPGRLGL